MDLKNSQPWLNLNRIVHFGETDAAGVMHFHHLLRWCHEAWEKSLLDYGLKPSDIFPIGLEEKSKFKVALPIVRCEADFLKPIKTGDVLSILLCPSKIDLFSFDIRTSFTCEDIEVARGLIQHVAIDPYSRKRSELPRDINLWLEASSINSSHKPV